MNDVHWRSRFIGRPTRSGAAASGVHANAPLPPLCPERIEECLADAESLVRGGADIGDPHRFLADLWKQTHGRCPSWLRTTVARRLDAMARSLDTAMANDSRTVFRQVA